MNRYIALLLLFVVSVVVGCMHHAADIKIPLAEKVKSQTVALVETHQGETQVTCAGVWVNDDTFLTARHCVEGSAQFRFLSKMDPKERMIAMFTGQIPEFQDSELLGIDMNYVVEDDVTEVGKNPVTTHEAKVLFLNKDFDIAAIKTSKDHPHHMTAVISTSVPSTGAELYIVGHTKGLYWTYMKGTMSSVRNNLPEVDTYGPFIQVVAPINKGNSGGGTFDSRGCLIGIVSFMYGAPGEGFLVHQSTIRRFLDQNHVAYSASL